MSKDSDLLLKIQKMHTFFDENKLTFRLKLANISQISTFPPLERVVLQPKQWALIDLSE